MRIDTFTSVHPPVDVHMYSDLQSRWLKPGHEQLRVQGTIFEWGIGGPPIRGMWACKCSDEIQGHG